MTKQTMLSKSKQKFRFRKFPVYQESRIFVAVVRDLCVRKFPVDEMYGLRSQLLRAANSVVLNIAEGSARRSDKDFAHFLTTALGSLNEVVACLDLAMDRNYISMEKHAELISQSENLANQLTAFRRLLLRID